MKLAYTSVKDDSHILLTDFNCAQSQKFLKNKNFYKIIWAREQKRIVVVDGYQITLEKDQIMFCTPLNVLEISQAEGLIVLGFNREFYCIRDHDSEVSCNGFLFYGSSKPPILSLTSKDRRSFDAMFLMIQEEFEMRDPIQGEMLRVLLKRLLITASRKIKAQLPEGGMTIIQFDLVRKFHILVEQHFRTKHKVAEYADLLYKSPKTLSNLFKKTGEKSPLKVINSRVLLEAKRLLLFSNKTSEEIGYEVGFNDAGHFSKFFKKHTGMPPTLFKKERRFSDD